MSSSCATATLPALSTRAWACVLPAQLYPDAHRALDSFRKPAFLLLSGMFDTTPEAARVQAEAHRRMGPAARFRVARDMSESFRRVALERIRAQHPELSDAQCRSQLVWELYGVRIPG
jgi:hypothetical protein